jgi:hypothetical protein
MTKVQTAAISDGPECASASTSASTLDIDDQLASTSLSTTKDLPEHLDDCVKESFLLGFQAAVLHSALRNLSTIREAVLGPKRIKQLIDEGCTPEMIGNMIASKQELLEGIMAFEGHVRDLALGFCLVQVASQFDTVSIFSPSGRNEPELTRFLINRYHSVTSLVSMLFDCEDFKR